jgi:xylose dehydrogenase (NAD/NADP)
MTTHSHDLRWGILSTSHFAAKLIGEFGGSAFRGGKFIAVASRDAEKAQKFAKKFALDRAFPSYDALISCDEVDAIYIPLPNSMHCEWTIRALESGKHVLCEKPLAMNAAEVERMTAAANANNRLLAEAFAYRFHPQTEKIRKIVAEKSLGDVKVVRCVFSFSLGRDGDVRWKPELGGGALYDIGCYCVNFIRFVLGEEPNHAEAAQVLSKTGVDETFSGILKFPSGALGVFDCSFAADFQARAEIIGSRGKLDVWFPWRPKPDRATFLVTFADKTETIETVGVGFAHKIQFEIFGDCAREGNPLPISLADSLANARVLDALRAAAVSTTVKP